jgi:ABC-type bacteriocin/lantibiotic exporter with double-glycine peptidase domain
VDSFALGESKSRDFRDQFFWFARQLRPLLSTHLIGVFFIVLSSVMSLFDPLIIKWMIDVVLPRKNVRLLVVAGAGFFVVYVSRVAFSSLGGVISFTTLQKLVFRMRLNLLKHINQLSVEFHENTPVGEKLYRIERDVDQVADIGSDFVPYVLRTVFSTIFVVVTMLFLNFRLTCMVLPLMPLFFVLKKRYRQRLRQASDFAQQQSARESSFLQEHLASLVQVILLHRERSQTRIFVDFSSERVRALKGRKLTEIYFGLSCMMIIVLGTITILSYGGYQVLTGALTIGGFVAFYSYLGRLFDPMNAAVEVYARLNRVGTNIRRIMEISEATPTVRERPDAIDLPVPLKGEVDLKGICFSYKHGPPVLTRLDLAIRGGEKVALVGASGSGKSTIAKLMARLYDVDEGRIRIDGLDVASIRLENLRTKICYLPQEPTLFDRSLKENLLLGDPNATDKEIREALEIAHLTDVVSDLPKGWDTSLGPRGGRLSGGERQRVALARAILQKPELLILDESTSAVDVPTEKRIFQRLREHFQNRTVVFIAHRVFSLSWVDRIIVLEQGTIQEQGSHDELFLREGLYRSLHGNVLSRGSNHTIDPNHLEPTRPGPRLPTTLGAHSSNA